MVIEPKKKRRKNPVTALSKGLEEDLRQQGYAASTIWKCTAPGFSDTRRRYAASKMVAAAAIHRRLVSAGLR